MMDTQKNDRICDAIRKDRNFSHLQISLTRTTCSTRNSNFKILEFLRKLTQRSRISTCHRLHHPASGARRFSVYLNKSSLAGAWKGVVLPAGARVALSLEEGLSASNSPETDALGRDRLSQARERTFCDWSAPEIAPNVPREAQNALIRSRLTSCGNPTKKRQQHVLDALHTVPRDRRWCSASYLDIGVL